MKTVLTQWGSRAVPFEAFDPLEVKRYVASLRRLLERIEETTGLAVFVTYGTLLGAVREGKVIANDFDFDLACVVRGEQDKASLVRTFSAAAMKVRGLPGVVGVSAASATQYAVTHVHDGTSFTVDLFLGWYEGDSFFQAFSIDQRFAISRADVFPLTEVTLEGVALPAPCNAEKLLACIYGETWRTPDPGFNYLDHFRAIGGLPPPENTVFGRVLFNQPHWDSHYDSASAAEPPTGFAVFSEALLPGPSRVFEAGSGCGRDLLYFLSRGHYVHGTDFSRSAMRLLKEKVDSPKGTVEQLDYADLFATEGIGTRLASSFDMFYARFLFHAVGEVSEIRLFDLARALLRSEGLLCAEFRTAGHGPYDKRRPWDELELTGDHYRRPIDPDDFCRKLVTAGFDVMDRTTGRGLALHTTEDPVVTRVVARKSPLSGR